MCLVSIQSFLTSSKKKEKQNLCRFLFVECRIPKKGSVGRKRYFLNCKTANQTFFLYDT